MIAFIESVSIPKQVNAGEKFTIQVELRRSQPRPGLHPRKGLYPQPYIERLLPDSGIHPRPGLFPKKGVG